MPNYWRGRVLEDEDEEGFEEEPGTGLGPDERDADLLDGSWEADYYAGRNRGRDWSAVKLGIGLLVVIGMVLPMLLVFVR